MSCSVACFQRRSSRRRRPIGPWGLASGGVGRAGERAGRACGGGCERGATKDKGGWAVGGGREREYERACFASRGRRCHYTHHVGVLEVDDVLLDVTAKALEAREEPAKAPRLEPHLEEARRGKREAEGGGGGEGKRASHGVGAGRGTLSGEVVGRRGAWVGGSALSALSAGLGRRTVMGRTRGRSAEILFLSYLERRRRLVEVDALEVLRVRDGLLPVTLLDGLELQLRGGPWRKNGVRWALSTSSCRWHAARVAPRGAPHAARAAPPRHHAAYLVDLLLVEDDQVGRRHHVRDLELRGGRRRVFV